MFLRPGLADASNGAGWRDSVCAGRPTMEPPIKLAGFSGLETYAVAQPGHRGPELVSRRGAMPSRTKQRLILLLCPLSARSCCRAAIEV